MTQTRRPKPRPQETFTIQGEVWLYPGAAGWHFVTLPTDESATIALLATPLKRAWGSVGVTATIGATSWRTSLFPDRKRGAYLLPVKASVRTKENITTGDRITVTLEFGAYNNSATQPSVRQKPRGRAHAASARSQS
jgi:hypothetical protein